MAGIQHLWLFIVSGLLLNITPGPAILCSSWRAARSQGWRAGVVACWGVGQRRVSCTCSRRRSGCRPCWRRRRRRSRSSRWSARRTWCGSALACCAPRAAVAAAVDDARPRACTIATSSTGLPHECAESEGRAVLPRGSCRNSSHRTRASKPLASIVLGAIFDINGLLWCHALALFTAFASRRLNGRHRGRPLAEPHDGRDVRRPGRGLALASR